MVEYRKWYPVEDTYEYQLNDNYTIVVRQTSSSDDRNDYTVLIKNNYNNTETATDFCTLPSHKIETVLNYSVYQLMKYLQGIINNTEYLLEEISEAYNS